jgi:hypothetical protein
MDQVSVTPSDEVGKKWIFMSDMDSEDVYFCEIGMADIQIEESQEEFECINKELHMVAGFLGSLYNSTKHRKVWSRFQRMIFQLRGEWPVTCSLCEKRNKQWVGIDSMVRPFIKNPLTDEGKALSLMRL